MEKILQGRSILVVDDDAACVHMTKLILQSQGANVFTAPNGADALGIAQNNRLDMIVADLLMPMMDGWTLVKALKKDPELNRIPVIAVTASYLNYADIEHALGVGFAKVLAKPVSVASLLEVVHLTEV